MAYDNGNEIKSQSFLSAFYILYWGSNNRRLKITISSLNDAYQEGRLPESIVKFASRKVVPQVCPFSEVAITVPFLCITFFASKVAPSVVLFSVYMEDSYVD